MVSMIDVRDMRVGDRIILTDESGRKTSVTIRTMEMCSAHRKGVGHVHVNGNQCYGFGSWYLVVRRSV